MSRTAPAMLLVVFSASIVPLAGCATSHPAGTPQTVTAATPQQKALLLDQMKQLSGIWETVDDKGHSTVVAVFSVTSGGTAVREILFPGGQHEMTNLYHMDGPTMVMTHYCTQGNQPRLRAVADKPGTIDFKLDSVTNMTSPGQMYMGGLTIVVRDPDTIEERWVAFQNDKVGEHEVFVLKRKKA